jgi:glycosyltransferase involved in cell wall biosynthesis
MATFWRAIDVLVVPSLTTRNWAEQFGRVVVEAMANDVPVIGSDSGAIPEVIGDAGLVVPEGDAEALAGALERLRGDAGLRARLVQAGRRRVREAYGYDVVVRGTVQLYEDVLQQGRRPGP